MYQIALCDDRTDELDKAEYLLRCYQKERSGCMVSIRRFLGADELLLTAREHEYVPDLVLMDIFMPGKLGVDAARELREMGVGCRIVFLTVSKDYALEAFRVDAVPAQAGGKGRPVSGAGQGVEKSRGRPEKVPAAAD